MPNDKYDSRRDWSWLEGDPCDRADLACLPGEFWLFGRELDRGTLVAAAFAFSLRHRAERAPKSANPKSTGDRSHAETR